MIRRPPRSTRVRSSAASDVYKRQRQDPAAAGSCLAGSALADLHVVVIAPAASRCATTAIWYRPLRSTLTAPLARRMPASGAVRVDLKGRYQMAVVAHRDAAGAITTTCKSASALPARQDPAAAGSCLCLLYTSDAADDLTRVDLGGRRI